jgi:hypothetical protein
MRLCPKLCPTFPARVRRTSRARLNPAAISPQLLRSLSLRLIKSPNVSLERPTKGIARKDRQLLTGDVAAIDFAVYIL